METATPNIGQALKKIRSDLKISLDTAAHLTGVSKAMLGQIERGESVPTISTLWKISTGLKVTFSNFISVSGQPHSIVRLDEIQPVQEEDGQMLLYNIFPFNPISGFDYFHISLAPGCRHQSLPHPNVESEYIVVTEGCLEMTVNDEVYILEKGCALSFHGNSDHCYANPAEEPVVFQNVIKYI